jgi:putative endonuclease
MWYLYILECKDKALYTGITDNVQRRFNRHSTKNGGHYTRYNPPVRIVYSEEFKTKSEAARREKQIKGWTRKKKLALIKGDLILLKKL